MLQPVFPFLEEAVARVEKAHSEDDTSALFQVSTELASSRWVEILVPRTHLCSRKQPHAILA